jgi:hypothetical protein
MGDCRWGQKDGDVGEVRHWTVGPCCQGDTGLLSAGERRLQTMGENGDRRFVTFLELQIYYLLSPKSPFQFSNTKESNSVHEYSNSSVVKYKSPS